MILDLVALDHSLTNATNQVDSIAFVCPVILDSRYTFHGRIEFRASSKHAGDDSTTALPMLLSFLILEDFLTSIAFEFRVVE